MDASDTISRQRLLDEFLQLVQIDSVTFEEAEVARYLDSRLRGLGFAVENDAAGPSTGNLIARLPGTRPGAPAIAFNAHMDTVEPGRGVKPVVRDGVVRSSGDTILGADCKAGVAAILEGVTAILQSGIPRPDLELIFTFAEERQHVGARQLDASRLSAGSCFTLDASGPIGTLITAAPCYYSLRAAFLGRASHAGAAPELGINALVAASRAIARMSLGRIDRETTTNIGLLRAGSGRNTVPARAELEGEARSHDEVKATAQVAGMTGIMREEADRIGATLDLQVTREYRPFSLSPDALPVRLATMAAQRLGFAVKLESTNGGSDANDLNEKGIPTVVLSSGAEEPHTFQEHVAVEDLVRAAQLVHELLAMKEQL
jgi:tripeptide aminopeptidase